MFPPSPPLIFWLPFIALTAINHHHHHIQSAPISTFQPFLLSLPSSQGEIFAAEGYAKSTGRVGVCIATSGPGATNLVTGLADAMMDSVPLVAITGQV